MTTVPIFLSVSRNGSGDQFPHRSPQRGGPGRSGLRKAGCRAGVSGSSRSGFPLLPGLRTAPGTVWYFWTARATRGTRKRVWPLPSRIVLHPRHLADESLSARRCRYNQQVFSVEQSGRFDRHLLDRHEVHDPPCLDEIPGQGAVLKCRGLLDRMGIDPVKRVSDIRTCRLEMASTCRHPVLLEEGLHVGASPASPTLPMWASSRRSSGVPRTLQADRLVLPVT